MREGKRSSSPNGKIIDVEINVGAEIASRLKEIYFKEVSWSKTVACDIALKLNILKRAGRVYFPKLNNGEILIKMRSFSDDDLKDALG